MSNKKKLIPALRFPEFKEDGEWEEKKLGEVFEFKSTNSLSREHLNYNAGTIRNIHYGDIHSKFSTLFNISHEDVPFINESALKSEIKEDNFCIKGDIILADASEDLEDVGKSIEIVELKDEKLVSGLHTLLARQKNNCFSLGFGGFLFKSNWIRKQIQREAQGAKVYGISAKRISKITLSSPTLPEQQKIADCLSSLDDLLAAHNEKLELLKGHKKGLMQNLFPQEGERVPKFRFPEFENNGEWEEITLGNICNLVRGPFGEALKKETFVKEGYAVYEQSHAIHNEFNSFRYYIDIENFSKLKRFSVKPGDLIMSCSGTMGRFAIIQQDFKMGIINQALLKLTVKDHNSNIFVKFLMETENNQSKLLSQSAGGAIKNVVSVSQIKELSLLIPSIPEQQKIASCLSAVDDLIKAETETIEALKAHKKGLMQGLFPKMEN